MACITPSEVLDEIKALFSWNPPRLVPGQLKKSSTTTRPPAFYDNHFSSKLALKRVVRLPSLVHDLSKNVDKALSASLTTLPSLDGFITAKCRANDVELFDREVADEGEVAMFYHMTTGKHCLQVASTLALHPSASFSGWYNLLSWTRSSPSSGYATKDGLANMDGLLRFRTIDQMDETWAAIVESMESKDRHIFEEMRKSKSPLATWEIQRISTGTAEMMNAVLNLAKADVKPVAVGPDAQAPSWIFPDHSLNTSHVSENCDEEINVQSLAAAPPPTLQCPVTRQVTRLTTSCSSTLPPQPSASRSSEYASPMKGKCKKRKRDEEKEEQKEGHVMTAQSLVQQAWAQAVRVDGTIIVLHSGNHELVCVRHRGSQTLYVSDVVEPTTCVDPGYGKLHVGIYIAAIQDAMDRKRQLLPISQPKSPGDTGGLIGIDEVGKREIGGFQCSAGRKVLSDDELVAIEKMIQEASDRDVLLLYLQYDVYDSPTPASFVRAASSIISHSRGPTPRFSPRAIRTCSLEDCLTIVLTSEIGRGATGVAHRGSTLKPEICDGAMPLDVVVKLAFNIEQRDALKSEYEVYRHLRSKGVLQGIPTVLGLFDESEDCACALVMIYAGVPLVTEPQGILSVSACKSALSTLESIHRAGILHGDIRRDNILMGDSGLTIIDFGHSKQCNDDKAKNKECARLRYLLGFRSLANGVSKHLTAVS